MKTELDWGAVPHASTIRAEMEHLRETGHTYFGHMKRAFSIAFVLIVHAIIPSVWETKATEMICSYDGGETGSTDGNR